MLQTPRVQVVLDLDNTMVHASGRSATEEPDLLRRLHFEIGKPLYDVWKARRPGAERAEIYQKVHDFSFRDGVETMALLQLRPALFEALVELRESDCDIHIYSKGKASYVHAVLRMLVGRLDSESLINGRVITKGEDNGSRKDLRNILTEDEMQYAVVLDDQPAVWLQLEAVLATPPFFSFQNMGAVYDADKLVEFKEKYLLVACHQISLVAAHIKETGDTSAEALIWLRSTLLKRSKHHDGRDLSLLIVAPKGADLGHRTMLEQLCGSVVSHGGHIAEEPNETVTHVVSDSVEATEWAEKCGDTYLVGVQWLVDTLLFVHKMDEVEYHPRLAGNRLPGVRDTLASRSREFLKHLTKQSEPHLNRFAAVKHTATCNAAIAAALLATLPMEGNEWLFAQHLFTTSPTPPFVVTAVPEVSPLSTILSVGDIIRGCARSDEIRVTDDIEELDLFKGEGSVLTLTIESSHTWLMQQGAVMHGWDVGIEEVVVVRCPPKLIVSSVTAACLVCLATVLGTPYCSVEVDDGSQICLSSSMSVLPTSAASMSQYVGKQVVAFNSKPIACLVDYYFAKRAATTPFRLLLSGAPTITATLALPPSFKPSRKRKREDSDELVGNSFSI